MEEILFRGKRRDNGKMIAGFYAVFAGVPFIGTPNSYGTMLWHPVHRKTVGRFTGTTDKTGAPLYEGDIVTFSGLTRFTVEYSTCRMGFYFSRLPNGGCIPGFTMAAWEHLEIIGNIHDNPELMRAAK